MVPDFKTCHNTLRPHAKPRSIGQSSNQQNPTIGFQTIKTIMFAIRGGITVAAGTRLAIRSIASKIKKFTSSYESKTQ